MTLRPDLIEQLSPAEKRALLARLLQERAAEVETEVYQPLSHGQRALWFLHQLAPDSPAYNILYAARLQRDVDLAALRRALQALIDRHAMLRATVATRDGQVMQRIPANVQAHIEEIDVSGWTPQTLMERLLAEADRPFDLERGPVMRCAIFHPAEASPVLALTFHHIAVDFWSLEVIVEELRALYAEAAGGPPAALPPVQAEYGDYVRWQMRMLDGPEGEKLWAYWQRQLAGELPVLELPIAKPRPPVQTYRGEFHRLPLSAELTARLRSLAQTEGTTLYVLLLAAFKVLLHRYTGQAQIVVGSPMAGRSRGEFARVVGYFINSVVLRSDLSDDPTFRELLARLRRTVLAALEHEDFPFPLLVERLQPKRDAGRSPLFQIAFVWDKVPQGAQPLASLPAASLAGETETPSLQLDPIAVGQRGAPFDLMLTVAEAPDSLTAVFQYNADLFEAASMARLTEHWQVLLEGILADPDRRVSVLPLLPEAERRRLIVEWNDTRADLPPVCVHQLFEAQADRTPEAVAIVAGSVRLTYGELNRRANQLAHYLRDLGLRPGDRVGLCLERTAEMVVGLLGVLKAGAAYVPMDPAYPRERLAFMGEDAGATLLLTEGEISVPASVARVIRLDAEGEQIANRSAENSTVGASPASLAYVIYTSGSTGKPKGVRITHRAVVNLLLAMSRRPGLAQSDVFLAVTSLSFDIAALELLLPLIVGARLVVAPQPVTVDGVRLRDLLAECGATAMQATPATWRLLLAAGWRGSPALKILCGGEALPRDLAEALLARGGEVWNLYGPTETTIWSTIHRVTSGQGPVSIGRPIANTQVYVLDRWRQPMPVGVPGDLYIGGAGLAEGYHNRPELTAEKFLPHLFDSTPGARLYCTGDIARFLPDGSLEFLGRADQQVKVRGFRLELEEIETTLRRHPAVGEAVVVALAGGEPPGEKRLVAYLVPDRAYLETLASPTEAYLSPEELRRYLKQTLPDYMLPAQFVLLERLPLTPNGKVDRRALPAPSRARPDLETHYVAPRSPTEKLLADLYAQVLGLEKIGVEDNFFELGGASIQVLQIVTLAAEAGLELKPEWFFVHQTVAALAAAIRPEVAPPPTGNTVIESLGVYLPPKEVSTQEVLASAKRPILFPLQQLTGIQARRMAGETEFSIDLAKKAVEACLANSRHAAEDIDLLICSNISRCDGPGYQFVYEPSTSARLIRHFGFKPALAFDLSNACPGLFTAILIADVLLKAGQVRCALVVSGEYITHLTKVALREIDQILDPRLACLTLGDAGAALILEASADDRVGFHALDLYTAGEHSRLCIAKLTDGEEAGAIMHTDSVKLTAVTIEQAVAHAGRALDRAGWPPETVRHVIMHQTSKTSIEDGAREINRYYQRRVCDDGNMVSCLAERGNTATTSHFVALMERIMEGRVRPGDRALFSITGSGLTVGTALYTFDDLPERLRRAANGDRPAKSPNGARRPFPRRTEPPGARIEAVGLSPDGQGNKSALQLAKTAAEACLANSSHRRHEIDLLLYAGVYRNEFLSEPAMAALLAGDLEINARVASPDDPKTLALDIFNGALGTLNACYVASRMIRSGRAKTALILASEIENNARIAPERTLGLCETGSALILDGSDGRCGFGQFVFRNFPEYVDAFFSYTALLNGRAGLAWRRDPRLWDYFLECLPPVIGEALHAEGIEMSRIKCIFPPQISPEFTARLGRRLNCEPSRIVNVADGRDLFSSSLAYGLAHARQNGLVESGDIGLIVAVGAGVQVGCAIYYF